MNQTTRDLIQEAITGHQKRRDWNLAEALDSERAARQYRGVAAVEDAKAAELLATLNEAP